jgi:hypothetical protein
MSASRLDAVHPITQWALVFLVTGAFGLVVLASFEFGRVRHDRRVTRGGAPDRWWLSRADGAREICPVLIVTCIPIGLLLLLVSWVWQLLT